MPKNDKLESTITIPRANRRGARLVLERPEGALNTVALQLVVSGRMLGQVRRQFFSEQFVNQVVIPLPDDFLPSSAQGWVRATFTVADVLRSGCQFLQRGSLVFADGRKEDLWDDFNLPKDAVADFITLSWTVVE